jgi:hypothetical protein
MSLLLFGMQQVPSAHIFNEKNFNTKKVEALIISHIFFTFFSSTWGMTKNVARNRLSYK